jgi:hypothetical protein
MCGTVNSCACSTQLHVFALAQKLDRNPEDCGKDADEVIECTVNLCARQSRT